MGRWEPDARGRLMKAALELFRERGFDETTVAEIAARAGLTERTFFRYFADKREVLFGGSESLRARMVDAIAGAPAAAAPLDAVVAAVEAACAGIEEGTGREQARRRYAVVSAHSELRERELIKLASLAASLAEALRGRGVKEPAASLVAEAGMAIFKVAFERWLDDAKGRPLARHIAASVDELRAVTAAPARPRAPSARKATARSRA